MYIIVLIMINMFMDVIVMNVFILVESVVGLELFNMMWWFEREKILFLGNGINVVFFVMKI